MKRDEAFAPFDEIEQGLLLLRSDLGGISVDDEPIVGAEDFGIERVDLVGIGQLDAPLGQDGLQLAKALGWPVMPVIAEKQDLDGSGDFMGGKWCERQAQRE